MSIHAADLNQDALSKLEAGQKFPVVQEQRQQKVEIAKDTIQGQVSLALEMMKDGKTPVIDLSKLPKLAGPVPNGYFEEVKEGFGEETAQKYKEFASYFTDLVIEKKQKYIAMKLKSVFNNPGEKRVFDIFIKKLKKYSNGKPVSQEKIAELKELTDKMGVALNKDLKELKLAIVKKSEIIRKKEEQIKEVKIKIEKLKKERAEIGKERVEIGKERADLRKRKIELEKEIKRLEKLIKERGDDLDKLKRKFG